MPEFFLPMKGYWNHIPVVRFLIPLLAGICTELCLPFPPVCTFLLFLFLFSAYIVLIRVPLFYKNYRIRWLAGSFAFTLLFLLGYLLAWCKSPGALPGDYTQYLENASCAECRILAPPEHTQKSVHLYAEVEKVYRDSAWHSTHGKALLFLSADSSTYIPAYGDLLIVRNIFREADTPKNPHEFNYKTYLQHQGIARIGFLRPEDFSPTGENRSKPLWKAVYALRQYCAAQLSAEIKDPDALSVSNAILLGNTSLLDPGLRQAYADAGTMHLLAVSGLHVAIFYMLLDFLLGRLKVFRLKQGKLALIKIFCILPAIWFYACVTGLSPSVTRASVMFSFLLLGRLRGRHADPFNILAASAIPLLLANPFCITEAGFQLSYAAVAGILFFQPLIASAWHPAHRVLRYFWSLCTVSVAAQAGTAPIAVYYFHQFPNYFFLSNLAAIPLAFLALTAGILFFAVSGIPILNALTAHLLESILRLLNGVLRMVDALPYSALHDLSISRLQVLILFGICISAGTFIILKKHVYLFAALSGVLLFAGFFCLDHLRSTQDISFSAYACGKQTVFCFAQGKRCALLGSATDGVSFNDYTFHIRDDLLHRHLHGVRHGSLYDAPFQYGELTYKPPYIFFHHKIIYVAAGDNIPAGSIPDTGVDYVILSEYDGGPLPSGNAEYILCNNYVTNNFTVQPVHTSYSVSSSGYRKFF